MIARYFKFQLDKRHNDSDLVERFRVCVYVRVRFVSVCFQIFIHLNSFLTWKGLMSIIKGELELTLLYDRNKEFLILN